MVLDYITARTRVKAPAMVLAGLFVVFAVVFSVVKPAQAASSSYLNFQARIMGSSGTIVQDGTYNIDFKIYNADSTTGSVGTCSGACLWEETRKNFSSQGVQVINGYFSVNLGSVTSFPTINWDQQLYLTMNIGGTSAGASPTWDGEMQNAGHSISLTALPYSFVAGQLALTSGAHRGTLGFSTVANDPVITLPDASGTVCLQNASACGFETTSGTDFIRNQTSAQTANFNIQSAASGSIGAVIAGASSQSVDILQVNGNGVANPYFKIGSGGAAIFRAATSTTAFQVQASGGAALLVADSQNSRIAIGQSSATYTLDVAGDINSTANIRTGGTIRLDSTGNLTNIGNFTATAGTTFATTGANGFTFKPGSDNSTFFQIQNSSSYQLLNVDTTADATNLITNGSFEANTTGWTAKNGSGASALSQVTSSSVVPYIGTGAMQITTSGSATNAGATYSRSFTNGQQYFLTLYARASGSNFSVFQIGNSNDNGSSETNCLSGQTVVTSNWTRYSCQFTYTGTTGTSYVYVKQSTNTARTYYIDGVKLETSSVATLYRESNIYLNGIVTSPSYFQNASDSTLGFQVNDSSGTGILSINTKNDLVNIGSSLAISAKLHITNGTSGLTALEVNQSTTDDLLHLQNNNVNVVTVDTYGHSTFKNAASQDSTTAFQVQNAAGSNAISIDTTGLNTLLTNSNFENTDVSAWTYIGTPGSVNRDTTTAYLGSASLNVTTSANANNGVKYVTGSGAGALAISSTYTLSWFDKLSSGSFTNERAVYARDGSTEVACSNLSTSTVVTTGYTQHSCQIVTDGTTAASTAYIAIEQSTGTARTINIDAVQLELNSSNTPYKETGISLNGVISSPVSFKNQSDSTTAFQIQNAAGTSNLFVVDTINGRIGIGKTPSAAGSALDVSGSIFATSSFVINSSSQSAGVFAHSLIVGSGSVSANDVVALDSSGNIIESTTYRDPRVYGVATTSASSAASARVALGGNTTVNVDSAAVSIGDQLVVSTSAGKATADNNATSGIVGIALSSKAGGSSGTVSVMVRPDGGQSTPTFRPTSDSATAFQVQNASGSNVFNIDTTSGLVGTAATSTGSTNSNSLVIQTGNATGSTSNSGSLTIDTGTATGTAGNISIGTGAYAHNLTLGNTTGGSTTTVNAGSGGVSLAGNTTVASGKTFTVTSGAALFGSNSSSGFQIQNSSSSKTVLAADTSGNKVVLGTAGASGITGNLQFNYSGSTGSISLVALDPSSTAYTINLPAENGTVCLQSSVNCGFLTGTTNSYIQNQSASDQTADFRISGTGRANTSLVTPLLDTAAAGTLSIGTATATTVTIGNATGTNALNLQTGTGGLALTSTSGGTISIGNNAAAQTINIGNGTGATAVAVSCGTGNCTFGANATDHTTILGSNSGTSATTIRGGTAGIALSANTSVSTGKTFTVTDGASSLTNSTGVALTVNNSTGGNSIALFQNNGTAVATIGNAGAVTLENSSDGANAFQVQNSSASDLINVNTTDGYVVNNGTADASNNLVQNPSFESSGSGDGTGWYTPGTNQAITVSSANAHSGNNELQVTGNSSTHAIYTKYFLVHPGDQIYLEGWVKNSGGANGDGGIYVEFTDKDKGNATYTNADTGLPGTSYILKSITSTIAAGKYYVRVAASVKATSTTGTFYFDDFYVKRVNEQSPLTLTNVSATAFQVQNSSSATVFGIDTTNSRIFTTIADSGTAVGFTLNTPSYTTPGAKLLSIQNNLAEKYSIDKDGNVVSSGGLAASGTISTSGNISTTGGNISAGSGHQFQINGTQISSADLSNDSNLAKINGTGPQTFTGDNKFTGTVLVQNNNSAGFQVQHAANAVFTVDTSGDKVILGSASNITGKIVFQGSGGAGTLTLTGPTTPDAGNYTLSIPAITANANICTDNSICTGYASSSSLTTKLNKNAVDTSSASVTALQGYLYGFTNNSSNIASGVIKIDNGDNTGNALYITGTNDYSTGNAYIVVNNTNGTPTGNLIDLQANAASKFSVDATGLVTAAGNITIASGKQYQINGVQIASSNLSDGANLAKLNGTQTFTGDNTFSSASNSFTGSGSGLTSLNATNVSSGTLNDGRLSSNVALLNRTAQTFTGDNIFAPTSNGAGTTIMQTSGTATSGSVLDVQTANGSSHFLQITNAAANEGAVTLQSVGATRDLTLGSGSGTIIIAAAANTIQHNNSSLTIDINNGTDSTLTITNSQGGAVANLSVEGDIAVGAAHVFKVGATSGTGSTCASNTFSQNQTIIGGIVSANTCANAVTSISASGGSIANGASISGNALTLGYADTSNPGLVSNTTQSFNGAKTFVNDFLEKSNSATAFQIQNTGAIPFMVVDTNSNIVNLGITGATNANATVNIGNSSLGTQNTNIGSSNAGTVAITGPTTITGRTSGTATSLALTNGAVGQVGLSVTGASGQTADLIQVQDTSGANMDRIDASGNIEVSTGYLNTAYGGNGAFSNLLKQSEAFEQVSGNPWTNTNVTTPTANTIVSPDGNTTAEVLTDSSSGGSVKQAYTTSTIGNYTFSVWLKSASSTQSVDLRIDSTGANAQTGTVKTVTARTTWQRFFVTQNITGPTITSVVANIFPGGTGGTNAVAVHAWGAQLVAGTSSQVYINTTANTVAAATGLVVNGNGLFVPVSDSTTAFQVQNAAGNNYIQADTQGANLYLGNTGIASTIQVGNNSGAVAQTINVGTNATGSSTSTVNIGQSTSGTANVNIGSVNAGTVAITGPATITNRTSGSSDTLVINNSSSTGTIAKFQDNGTNVMTLADGGAATFQNTTNSAAGFQIQNAAGYQLFGIDTTPDSANLVTCGSFETTNDITGCGWAAKNGSGTSAISRVTSSTVVPFIGTGAMQITTSGSATDAGATFSLSNLTNSVQYTLTLYARASGSNFSVFSMGNSNNGSSDAAACLSGQTVVTGNWSRFSCQFTYSGTTNASTYIYVKQSNATGRTYYVDGVKLEVGATATPYKESTLNFSGIFAQPTTFQNGADSTIGFQVLDSGTTSILSVNTKNDLINIGSTLATTAKLHIHNGGAGLTALEVNQSSTSDDLLHLQSSNVSVVTVDTYGHTTFKNAASQDSASAFQVQNAIGSNSFVVDTTGLNTLLTNSSYENSTVSTWTYSGASGGSVARDTATTTAYQGSATLKVITGTSAAAFDGVKSTLNSTLSASTQYTISWYDRITSGTFTDVIARFSYDGTTGNASSCTSINTQTVVITGWTRHACQFTTGSSGTAPNSSNAIYIVQQGSNSGTQRTFYIDSVQLEQAANSTAYKETGITLNGVVSSAVAFKNQADSTTAFQVQNSSGINILVIDSINKQLEVMDQAGGSNYALVYYASNTANFTASSGTVAVGRNAGAITVSAGSGAAVNITANAASSWQTTSGTLTLQSGSGSSDFLILNANGSSQVQVNGSAVLKLGSASADPTCTTGSIFYNSTTNLFRGCTNGTWATLSNVTQTLQQSYNQSTGSTTPEVKLNAGGTDTAGVDIQDADSSIGGVLFAVRGTNAAGLGTSLFNVSSANNTVNIGASGTAPATLVLGSDTDADIAQGATTGLPSEVDGGMFYSTTNHNFICGIAGSWLDCNGLLYSNTSSPSAVNTCTTACAAFGKAAAIPANYCKPGRVIHVIARGIYGLQNVVSQTFALGVYYGTDSSVKTNDVLLGTSTSTTTQTNLSNNGWKLDTTIVCYDTTHMQTEGDFTYSISNTAATAAQVVLQNDTATTGTSVTTTTAKNIYLFPAYGASNGSNTSTLQQLIVYGN